MAKSESAYTSDVLAHIRKSNPNLVVVKTNDRTTAGIPDAFVCRDDGRTLWIEFKVSRASRPSILTLLTSAQRRTLEKMHALGTPYHILVRTPAVWKVYDVHGFTLDLTPSAKETAAWLAK